MIDERPLGRVLRRVAVGQPFDVVTAEPSRVTVSSRQVLIRPAVDQNGVRPAPAVVAASLGARMPRVIPQGVE